MPMPVKRREGKTRRVMAVWKESLQSQRGICSTQMCTKSWKVELSLHKQYKQETLLFTVHCGALGSGRLGLKSQPSFKSKVSCLIFELGVLYLCNAKRVLIRMQLKGESSLSRLLGSYAGSKSFSFLERRCDSCKSCSETLKPKARYHCLRHHPDVSSQKAGRTGSTRYLCTCHKGSVEPMLSLLWKEQQRPGKRREVWREECDIKISTS